MAEKLIVGPINGGMKKNLEAFAIDNDSFPQLINAYQWRGRIKRKRGTSFLNRLTRYFDSSISSYGSIATILVDGAGNANLITGFSLESNATIVPESVILVGSVGAVVYTDPTEDGYLTPTGTGGPNTINYSTGAIFIPAQAGGTITAIFRYYPNLPVMGLEDLILDPSRYPGTLGFDTRYAYNILTAEPYFTYSVSFYKNPPVSALLPGYAPKGTPTSLVWNGRDYQQFYTANYQNALWATNGINVPFNITNIGMQYKPILTVTVTSGGPPAIATLQITGHGLIVGDFVFVNEVLTTTGINFQTGYVISVIDVNNVSVEFPNATIANNGTGGIAQYLTSNANPTLDCIRWYDGDPTDANANSPSFIQGRGWVNFMPPLSRAEFSIADTPPLQYYLAGARLIVPFKDRILFLGAVIQSAGGAPIYLPDTIVYSQNGTPYYTSSFTGDPSLANTVFNQILVPPNQTATAGAFWGDQTGFGGWVSAGIQQPILTSISSEDVLLLGFTTTQIRLVYTGNDIVPFNFFTIDSELSSGSTFSAINMSRGGITRGDRGIVLTTQNESKRIDLDIPDNVFQMDLTENGAERVTAQRDYINEWIYLTYVDNQNTYKFPTETLQYNYRDDSWAIFKEAYTTYGQFRKQTGFIWATVGNVYQTWASWNAPWNAGSSTLLAPEVIAGNQQGFILVRDDGTNESNSLYIRNVVGNVVTSPDHCLNIGDYIVISEVLGTTGINGNIFSVSSATTDTITLNPAGPSGTYLGLGLIKRMYVPYVQTKQFPLAWAIGRKTRIGTQQYLLSSTNNGQIQLLIFLSQNSASAYNEGNIVPVMNSVNNSLIYSTVLFTCPESTNLGLTPANVNLQMITEPSSGSTPQQQIWHRINTSLIGDTVQLGFTMSDSQMRDTEFRNQFEEIEIHGFNLDVSSSQLLC